jgi:hypothetical protein
MNNTWKPAEGDGSVPVWLQREFDARHPLDAAEGDYEV